MGSRCDSIAAADVQTIHLYQAHDIWPELWVPLLIFLFVEMSARVTCMP